MYVTTYTPISHHRTPRRSPPVPQARSSGRRRPSAIEAAADATARASRHRPSPMLLSEQRTHLRRLPAVAVAHVQHRPQQALAHLIHRQVQLRQRLVGRLERVVQPRRAALADTGVGKVQLCERGVAGERVGEAQRALVAAVVAEEHEAPQRRVHAQQLRDLLRARRLDVAHTQVQGRERRARRRGSHHHRGPLVKQLVAAEVEALQVVRVLQHVGHGEGAAAREAVVQDVEVLQRRLVLVVDEGLADGVAPRVRDHVALQRQRLQHRVVRERVRDRRRAELGDGGREAEGQVQHAQRVVRQQRHGDEPRAVVRDAAVRQVQLLEPRVLRQPLVHEGRTVAAQVVVAQVQPPQAAVLLQAVHEALDAGVCQPVVVERQRRDRGHARHHLRQPLRRAVVDVLLVQVQLDVVPTLPRAPHRLVRRIQRLAAQVVMHRRSRRQRRRAHGRHHLVPRRAPGPARQHRRHGRRV
mmetsp:Transcript_2403/g.8149  ORF Transcript_2403/g.8149 Transcript_2403/m.8149 type:complete len:469 (+) Transcript_2403:1406-2812(+)